MQFLQRTVAGVAGTGVARENAGVAGTGVARVDAGVAGTGVARADAGVAGAVAREAVSVKIRFSRRSNIMLERITVVVSVSFALKARKISSKSRIGNEWEFTFFTVLGSGVADAGAAGAGVARAEAGVADEDAKTGVRNALAGSVAEIQAAVDDEGMALLAVAAEDARTGVRNALAGSGAEIQAVDDEYVALLAVATGGSGGGRVKVRDGGGTVARLPGSVRDRLICDVSCAANSRLKW